MAANPKTQSDATLMAAVRAGDAEQLDVLFRRYHGEIHGFLKRASRSATLADDLTQEVFLRVLRYRSSFDGESAFRPWLFRIARNLLADRFKKVPTPTFSEQEVDSLQDPRPSQLRAVEDRERLARLEWALAHLSDEQRDALLLARFHDLTYQEIGEVLACSEGAVKARVFRALGALHKLLEADSPERPQSTRPETPS